METEGVSFPEAVERLAAMAGVALPKFSKEEVEREEKRKSLHDVMELAAKFFEATLASRLGAKARGYLADRRLDGATQLKFRMGYAPNDRYALKEHLGKQGVSVDDMIATGLLDQRRRHPGAVRPLPRPGDVPDHRFPRPHHRIRRPRAR